VLPSLYVPVAVYWTVVPTFTDGLEGVTAIDTNTAGPTVRVVLPLTAPEVALIRDVPWAAPAAWPSAVTVATAGFDEAQVDELVRSNVDPSEYVPVALNCLVVPLAIDGFTGVTAIETNTAGPTVRVVLTLTAPELALIVDVPCATPVASPPAVMVATALLDEAHVAE